MSISRGNRGVSVKIHPDSDQIKAPGYIGQGLSILSRMAFMAKARGDTIVTKRVAIGIAGFMILTWSIYYVTMEIFVPKEEKKKKVFTPYITILDNGTQDVNGFWADFSVPMYDTDEAAGTMFHQDLWESYTYETANDELYPSYTSKNYVYMQKSAVVNGWVEIKDWPGAVLTECYNDPLILSYDGRRLISTEPYATLTTDGAGGATSNCGEATYPFPSEYLWGLVGNKSKHTYSRLKATNSSGEVEVHIEITYEPGEPKVIWNVYTPEICNFPDTENTVIINKYYGTYPLYQ